MKVLNLECITEKINILYAPETDLWRKRKVIFSKIKHDLIFLYIYNLYPKRQRASRSVIYTVLEEIYVFGFKSGTKAQPVS